jgi:hypothetical protein
MQEGLPKRGDIPVDLIDKAIKQHQFALATVFGMQRRSEHADTSPFAHLTSLEQDLVDEALADLIGKRRQLIETLKKLR